MSQLAYATPSLSEILHPYFALHPRLAGTRPTLTPVRCSIKDPNWLQSYSAQGEKDKSSGERLAW